MDVLNKRGLVMVGCGFMGKALLEGWFAAGLRAEAVTIQDPTPSEWLRSQSDLRVNTDFPENPAAILIATKPQILDQVLPGLKRFGGRDTTIISIAAGAPISLFQEHLGMDTPIIRAMPNLPVSVGLGATALVGSSACSASVMAQAEDLFRTLGLSVTLPDEDLLHLVTGLSGSGPAYVFALAEAMADAAHDLGLPLELARPLARQTVAGAGGMLAAAGADSTELREAVTSKGGTTAAGLEQLTRSNGLAPLLRATIDAARARSIELSVG